MKLRIAFGMLGLALAGCAQSRSSLPSPPGAAGPIGVEPIPVLNDTINRGMGDRAVQRTALGDPNSPRWSGSFVPERAGVPAGAGTPDPVAAPAAAPRAVRPSPSSPGAGPNPAAAAVATAAGTTAAPSAAPPDTDVPAASTPAAAAAEGLPPVDEPAPAPAAPVQAPPSDPATRPAADSLLGPDPNLSPMADPPREGAAAGAQAVVPASPDGLLEAAPSVPADPHPQAAAGPSADANQGRPAAAAVASRAPAQGEGVVKASFAPDVVLGAGAGGNLKQAGRAAARVGNEVITVHDLIVVVQDQIKRFSPDQRPSQEEILMVSKTVLAGLIERMLIAQEAKRILKNPKQLNRLYEAADQYWREQELPPMMRRYVVENEAQLREKMAESGKSLSSLHQNFRQDFLAQAFLEQKLMDCRKVELPEMLKYYNEHVHDRQFDRPAQITWREIIVEYSRHPSPGDARKKAEALLTRLSRGEDFAALARAESEGPTAVKAQGGLMETSPGSYAVDSVNKALAGLPLNQVSPILEGPTSLHIVKVQKRRNAGPATFEEVQEQVRRTIMVEKLRKGREDLIAKLRQNTPVSNYLDGTEYDPTARGTE
ncbi:peptidylprolyl isomerase [Aquisphaera giovannonii]|uniref:Peptidylprolyl isomerase n=1 Tax=Aquisphaera giovannonii TaxID=406548 RepID=A0A5B9VZU9_9BACT|nr:peptidylprolyl isomerase [Aquisphaera giovannonii]QEH33511.1 peptidylprolyl isomerase [Aquisphaera giovannonii]